MQIHKRERQAFAHRHARLHGIAGRTGRRRNVVLGERRRHQLQQLEQRGSHFAARRAQPLDSRHNDRRHAAQFQHRLQRIVAPPNGSERRTMRHLATDAPTPKLRVTTAATGSPNPERTRPSRLCTRAMESMAATCRSCISAVRLPVSTFTMRSYWITTGARGAGDDGLVIVSMPTRARLCLCHAVADACAGSE